MNWEYFFKNNIVRTFGFLMFGFILFCFLATVSLSVPLKDLSFPRYFGFVNDFGTVSKSNIPAAQFEKAKNLFVDPKSKVLAFKPDITDQDIEKIKIPVELKNAFKQANTKVLDAATAYEIEGICSSLEARTGAELAVVVLKTIDPFDIETYSVKLFEDWKIGKRKIDNGILFILAVAERKVRIEVGYGLEGVLPDAKTGEILDQYVLPSFKKGDYGSGMLLGTAAIAKVITETYQGDGKFVDKEDESFGLIFFIILLVISSIVFLFSSSKIVSGIAAGIGAPVGWFYFGGLEGMGLGVLIGTIMGTGIMSRGGGFFSGGGFGGGGSGSGGFGGFGGGRSGGGGASRGF